MQLVIGGDEIEIERIDVDKIYMEIIENLLREIKDEKKLCAEYPAMHGTYVLCRDPYIPNQYKLSVYYP